MSVYEELLEKKKQKRIKYELEQTKKDNQNINNKLSELEYVHSIALEQNRECHKKIDCYVLEIERLTAESTEWESKCYKYQDIINELEKYLEKTIIDGGTRGSMTFWYKQIYEYLKELKEGK